MIYPNNQLPPEYRKALAFVDNLLSDTITSLPVKSEIAETILQEGNYQLTKKKFRTRDIPCGEHWRWNQSKGRFTAKLPKSNKEIEFFKLIPRAMTKIYKTPKMKLWVFKVSCPDQPSFRVLWCEKGNTKEPNIEELEFLRAFMPEQLANEIWPNSANTLFDSELTQLLLPAV